MVNHTVKINKAKRFQVKRGSLSRIFTHDEDITENYYWCMSCYPLKNAFHQIKHYKILKSYFCGQNVRTKVNAYFLRELAKYSKKN